MTSQLDTTLESAVMAGFGLLLLLGGQSETVRGMRGAGRDGATFGLLGALGGVAYLVALLVQRVRA